MNERLARRLGWLETSIRLAGGVDRQVYRERFALSAAQASEDMRRLAAELKAAGGSVEIRRNRVHGDLPELPVFPQLDPLDWLAAQAPDAVEEVSAEVLDEPGPAALGRLVAAIAARSAVRIAYISQSSGYSVKRISPNTVVRAVGRRHLRGYDHERGRYADFALGRMRDVGAPCDEVTYFGRAWDAEWHRWETIDLRPADGLDAETRRAVELAYTMSPSGGRAFRVRAALRPYALQSLGLMPKSYVPHLVAVSDGAAMSR